MRPVLAMLLVVVFCTGCSSVQVKPLESDAETGVRFYQPEPYLLVTVTEIEGKSTTLKSEIVWLPNFKKGYIAKPIGCIGSSDVQVTLDAGWNLTRFGLDRDSQAAEMLGATSGLVTAVAALGQAEKLQPGLYQFVYDDEGHVEYLKKLPTK